MRRRNRSKAPRGRKRQGGLEEARAKLSQYDEMNESSGQQSVPTGNLTSAADEGLQDPEEMAQPPTTASNLDWLPTQFWMFVVLTVLCALPQIYMRWVYLNPVVPKGLMIRDSWSISLQDSLYLFNSVLTGLFLFTAGLGLYWWTHK